MTRVEFFWDVGSPYTYLASTQIEGLRQRTGVDVTYRPFLLGGVFKAVGHAAPLESAAKMRHMLHDLQRWADDYRIPMRLPGDVPFPLVTILPMRVAVAADAAGCGERYCQAVFRAYWAEGLDVSKPEVLAPVIAACSMDPTTILADVQTQDIKDRLRALTDEAVARGAFGAPTFFVGDDLYFGNDRLQQLEARLLTARS